MRRRFRVFRVICLSVGVAALLAEARSSTSAARGLPELGTDALELQRLQAEPAIVDCGVEISVRELAQGFAVDLVLSDGVGGADERALAEQL